MNVRSNVLCWKGHSGSEVGLHLPYFLTAVVGEPPNEKHLFGEHALQARLDALDAKRKSKAEISFEERACRTGLWTLTGCCT